MRRPPANLLPCRGQLVTRSFTSSNTRSTACTPCLAAEAPCCITLVATRLIRVTGDCFLAVRLVVRFDADFFRGVVDLAEVLVPALRFREPVLLAALFADAVFVLARRPAAVRFDAADDLPRAFPPDDFDAVAMISFLEEGAARLCARFAHSRGQPVARRTIRRFLRFAAVCPAAVLADERGDR